MNLKRFRIFLETIALVILIVIAKFLASNFGLEILSLTPLHTGLLAGSVFVLGFILSTTHADFKESERMPVDLTTAIEGLYQDGLNFKKQYKGFDFAGFTTTLKEILSQFKKDIQKNTNDSQDKALALSPFFAQMEKLGVPPNFIVKLKQEQTTVLRIISRKHYLQVIRPLPSAFILVESIVVIIIVMLILTKIGSLIDAIATTAFLSFIYIYMLRLIKVMDIPFHREGSTQDDVSLFLLEEQQDRIKE